MVCCLLGLILELQKKVVEPCVIGTCLSFEVGFLIIGGIDHWRLSAVIYLDHQASPSQASHGLSEQRAAWRNETAHF